MTQLSYRRVVSVAIGALLIVSGILEFLSMKPSVLAGTLQNADVMSAVLGVQFFAALALVAYGAVIAHRQTSVP